MIACFILPRLEFAFNVAGASVGATRSIVLTVLFETFCAETRP